MMPGSRRPVLLTLNQIAITGGTMGIETLNAMNEGMQANLMMMIEVIMLIGILFTVLGLAIYLAGVAWHCFDESDSLRRLKKNSRTRTITTLKRLTGSPNL
jgi:putative exporter of polyketide antibiotics